MNFYEFLIASKKRNTKRFSDLTETEVNRNEKELRLENKMDATSGSEELLSFIKALQENPLGLDFLIDNPNLSQALFLQKTHFKELDRMQIKGYERTEIQHFFNQILQTELENAIGEAVAKDHYSRLTQIAKFNRYLPEDIIQLLKSKILDKLALIKIRVKSGVIGVFKELELIRPILIFLGDQNLIQKEKAIYGLALSNSLKDAGDPGIVSFFKMIGEFFDAIGTQPENLIEKEKKRETLRGCGWVFMVVVVIILCCFLFLKACLPEPPVKMNAKDYPANNKNSDKFPAYLTDFNRTDITDYQYVGPSYGRGVTLDKQFSSYPDEPLTRGPAITNYSSYDLIVFSNENLFEIADSPSSAATYIKSSKSGHSGAFYLNRMYFGDSLSLFNTSYDKSSSTTKRFLVQPAFSKEAIEYRINFRSRSAISIRDTLDRVFIDGSGGVELYDCNGIREIKEFPFIFPPLLK